LGPTKVRAMLEPFSRPQVVVMGSSHSALTAAWALLNRSGLRFAPQAITILHHQPFRVFYPSHQHALDDGYHDFSTADICPATRRVHRLGGLRMDGRDLMRRVLGLGGVEPESRVQLMAYDRTSPVSDELRQQLDDAHLIVPAFGYRPAMPELRDESAQPIPLNAHRSSFKDLPLVDDNAAILKADQEPLANAWGVGLASGFRNAHCIAGEPSFTGQTNGIWLYQNNIGHFLRERMLRPD
jgi:hypothetical protein